MYNTKTHCPLLLNIEVGTSRGLILQALKFALVLELVVYPELLKMWVHDSTAVSVARYLTCGNTELLYRRYRHNMHCIF